MEARTPEARRPVLDEMMIEEQQLLEEVSSLEDSGNYLEAQSRMNSLKKLRIKMGEAKHRELQSEYRSERKALEEQQGEETERLLEEWDRKLEDYNAQATELLKATSERHRMEKEEAKKTWTEKLMMRPPKFSSRVLSMRRSLEILVRAKDYSQASQQRVKLEQLEREEEARHVFDVQQAVERKMIALTNKTVQEVAALKQRIDLGRDDLLRQRKADVERLRRQHQNRLQEHELQRRLDDSRARSYLAKHRTVMCSTPKRTTLDIEHIRRSPDSPSTRSALDVQRRQRTLVAAQETEERDGDDEL